MSELVVKKTFSLYLGNLSSSGLIHISSPRSRDGRGWGGPAAAELLSCLGSLSSPSSLVRVSDFGKSESWGDRRVVGNK